MSQQPQAQQAGPGGGLAECCGNCYRSTPVMTRVLMFMGLFAAIAGGFLAVYFYMDAQVIIQTKGLGLYRLFLSPFFNASFFDGFFVILMVYMILPRLEMYKGSMLVFLWSVAIALLTNVILFALGALFVYAFGVSTDSSKAAFLDTGMWSMLFGLMAIDSYTDPRLTRRFMCCPFEVKTMYQPIIFLIIMELMRLLNGMFNLGMVIGLLLGYALVHYPALELRADRIRRYEAADWSKFLTERALFIRIDSAGQLQPWQFGQPPVEAAPADNNRAPNGGPRVGMMGVGDLPSRGGGQSTGSSSSSSSSSGGSKSSVFSGTGYKLGSASGAATASSGAAASSTPSQTSTSERKSGGTATGTATGGKTRRPGSVLADRMARAKAAATATGTATTTATATPTRETSGGGAADSDSVKILIGAESSSASGGVRSSPSTTGDRSPSVSVTIPLALAGAGGAASSGVPPLSLTGASTSSGDSNNKKKSGGKDVERQPMLSAAGAGDDDGADDPFTAGIRRLTDLGYSYDDSLRVMNSCDGDVERAIEILSQTANSN